MGDGDDIRDVLLEYSDHRAVRNVFGEYTDQGTAERADYAEALRETGGRLALVAADGVAEVYVRWNGSAGRYERLTMWPPWTIAGYEHADRAELVDDLRERDHLRPTLHELTPFADEQAMASLSNLIWP